MKNNNVLKAIEELDLEQIKTKLMHVASGEGWSRAKVDAMEIEYRRFLYLMHAFPQEETAPTVDVDTFWHYHILDTMKYAADCEATFGYFLHHYPYVGLDTAEEAGFEERGGDRMRELYEQTFGQAYIRSEAYGMAAAATDVQQAGSQAAYCMYRPDSQAVQMSDVQQAGSQAAYCMYRPDAQALQVSDVQQAGSQAAYCMYRPDAQAVQASDVQQAGAKAAYCMYRPDAQQASVRGDVQQAGAKAAYCMYRPDAAATAARDDARPDVQQAGAKAAYCMYRPDAAQSSQLRDVQQAGAKAAYCMYRPDARQADQPAPATAGRDVQEAGAKAAYCMYRPDAKQASAELAESAAQQPAAPAPIEAMVARSIMVGSGLAAGAPAAYRVLAAGSGKADIALMAARPELLQAGIPAAAMPRSAGAVWQGMPIRPAMDLVPA